MWETSEIITRQSNRSLEDWSFYYNAINIGLNVELVGLFVGMKWRIKQLGTSRVNKSEPQLDSTELKENYFFFFLSGTLKQEGTLEQSCHCWCTHWCLLIENLPLYPLGRTTQGFWDSGCLRCSLPPKLVWSDYL